MTFDELYRLPIELIILEAKKSFSEHNNKDFDLYFKNLLSVNDIYADMIDEINYKTQCEKNNLDVAVKELSMVSDNDPRHDDLYDKFVTMYRQSTSNFSFYDCKKNFIKSLEEINGQMHNNFGYGYPIVKSSIEGKKFVASKGLVYVIDKNDDVDVIYLHNRDEKKYSKILKDIKNNANNESIK